MVMFGHIDCAKCWQHHPDSGNCQAPKPVREMCVTFMDGLDDGPWLPGRGPRKRQKSKSADELYAIRAKAWATRRNVLGPKGHR